MSLLTCMMVQSVVMSLTRNPFRCQVDTLPDEVQEEFLDLINDSSTKDRFDVEDICTFWAKTSKVYGKIGRLALGLLIPFSSTYLCESGFSTLLAIKTEYRSKLDVEPDLRCALSDTRPNIPALVSKKQCQVSH